jgi:hypothetical protein
LRRCALLPSSHPRPVASFNPMPPAEHDRLPGGTLAGMVAYTSDRKNR